MSDLLPRFKARWEQALAEFDKQEFGRFAPFIKLKADCAKEGFQPCSSQACTRKVLKLSEFNADGKGRKLTRCTHCHHGAGAKAATEASKQAGKRQAEAVAEAGPKFSAIQVENDAREYLSAMLAALSDEAKRLLLAATPEFRTADAGLARLRPRMTPGCPFKSRRTDRTTTTARRRRSRTTRRSTGGRRSSATVPTRATLACSWSS